MVSILGCLITDCFCLLFRLKTPPRPQGQRTEPESRGGVSRFIRFLFAHDSNMFLSNLRLHLSGFCLLPQMFQGFGDTGFHMSFGIGAFPFGFFTTVFNTNDPFHRAGECTKKDTNIVFLLSKEKWMMRVLNHQLWVRVSVS